MTKHIDVTRDGCKLIARFTQESLQHFATSTLIGSLFDGVRHDEIKTVNLVFVETSLSWRQHNHGPDEWIMLEYVPKCLIDDVLWLVEHGYKVTTATEIAEGR